MSNTTQVVSVEPGKELETTTPMQQLMGSIVGYAIIGLAIVSNLGSIFVITRSHLRASFSGTILINQAIADTGFLTMMLAIIAEKTNETDETEATVTLLVLLSTTFIGVGAHSMAMVSVNLCLAICHYQLYKSLITNKKLAVIICTSWLLNASFMITSFRKSASFLYYDGKYRKVMARVSSETWWMAAATVVNCPLFPLVTSSVCFVLVKRYASKVVPTALNINSVKRYKLTKAILINMTLFTSTYVLLLMANSLPWRIMQNLMFLLHLVYHIAKLPLLLKFYPVLSETWMLCKWMRRITPETELNTSNSARVAALGRSGQDIHVAVASVL